MNEPGKPGRPPRSTSVSRQNKVFRCTREENEALEWHANEHGETVSWLIREALEKAGFLKIPED
jgi:predicted DNA-binding protein